MANFLFELLFLHMFMLLHYEFVCLFLHNVHAFTLYGSIALMICMSLKNSRIYFQCSSRRNPRFCIDRKRIQTILEFFHPFLSPMFSYSQSPLFEPLCYSFISLHLKHQLSPNIYPHLPFTPSVEHVYSRNVRFTHLVLINKKMKKMQGKKEK